MSETPAPYDVVLGGSDAIARSAVPEAIASRILKAATPEERQAAVALALRSDKGIEIIKALGTQWCVAVSLANNSSYVAVIYEAVRVDGYQSLYWFARSASAKEFQRFEDALGDAKALAVENSYPLFYEVGHLTRADWGWSSPEGQPVSPWQQAYLYPVTEKGNRIKFSGKTHFTKSKIAIATEADRIGMSPVFRKRDVSHPMDLWRCGVEATPDEKLLETVTQQLEQVLELKLIHAYRLSSDNATVTVDFGGARLLIGDKEEIAYENRLSFSLSDARCFLLGMQAAKLHLEMETVRSVPDLHERYRTIKAAYKELAT